MCQIRHDITNAMRSMRQQLFSFSTFSDIRNVRLEIPQHRATRYDDDLIQHHFRLIINGGNKIKNTFTKY